MSSIVVIGSSNIDMVLQLSHIPKAGETVGGGVFSQVNGGKGANQAVAAARAGGNVSFVSCVGNDSFGNNAIQQFKADRIDTAYMVQTEKAATGIALIFVSESGENSIGVGPGANYQLLPQHIDNAQTVIASAEIALLQLEVPLETVAYAIKKAKQLGTKVLLNPAPAQPLSDGLLKMVDILVVNETEGEILSGQQLTSPEDIPAIAARLQAKGPETVILTLGANGAYVLSGEENHRITAFEVKAVDSTAAGDVFCGTLAVALAEGKDVKEATLFASAAAAISVTRLGAQPSAPSKGEVLEFMET